MQNSWKNNQALFTNQNLPTILAPEKNGYTVYGDDYCGFTSAARNLLQATNTKFVYRKFSSNRQLRNEFARKFAFNHGTIPMIFLNGQFIGGYDQLKNHLRPK